MTDKKIYIYGLADPRTNQYRYIGRTLYPWKRLLAQIATARSNNPKTRVHTWIRSLLNLELEPVQNIIEIVPERRWADAEKWWIEYFKNAGCKLVNMVDGGEGSCGRKMSNDEKKRRGIIQKRRYENPQERIKTSNAIKKAYEDNPELRNKQRIATKKRYEDPKERKKTGDAGKKRYENPRERELQSIRIKKALSDPELRQRLSDIQTERYRDPKERKKMSVAGKKYYANPKTIDPKKGIKLSEETRRKMSISAKNRWRKERKAKNI